MPDAPHPLPTYLDSVMTQILGRLVSSLRWPEERVIPYDPDDVDYPPPQADQLCHVWPDPASTLLFAGAGRLDTRGVLNVVVDVSTRYAVDEKQSGRLWLLDRRYGHLRACHAAFNALNGYWPEDPLHNVLLDRPMQLVTSTKPKRLKIPPGWGYSRVGFKAVYILQMDNPTVLL
jgi:hypothetical protein